MFEPHVTLLGRIVAPPRHIITDSGVPLLTMRLASTPRWYDRNRGEWRDGESLFLNVTCWRSLADNVAASVRVGMPVVVSGRLRMRTWADKAGERRSALEVEAFSVGPDLRNGVVTFQRTPSQEHTRDRPPNRTPGGLSEGTPSRTPVAVPAQTTDRSPTHPSGRAPEQAAIHTPEAEAERSLAGAPERGPGEGRREFAHEWREAGPLRRGPGDDLGGQAAEQADPDAA